MAEKMKPSPKIIGLTGTNGAGKGEAAAFFQRKGYTYHSLSDLIREELIAEGVKPSRDNLIKKGNDLRRIFGPDILARRVMSRVEDRAVIDSIRNPDEILYLRSQKKFILLAIDAPVELRFERVNKRGRQESANTLEEFIHKEAEEMTRQRAGQQLSTCMEMSDNTIINNGSLESFYAKLEEFA